MPLIIPKPCPHLPMPSTRKTSLLMHRERARSQHIRPLEILILNLMPTKMTTTQIARLLANTPLQVHMTLLQRPAMRRPTFRRHTSNRSIRTLTR